MVMRRKEPRGGIERRILTTILWVGIMPMAIALSVGVITALDWQATVVGQALSNSSLRTSQSLSKSYDALAPSLAASPEIRDIVESSGARGTSFLREIELTVPLSASPKRAPETRKRAFTFTVYDAQGLVLASSNEATQRPLRPEELSSEGTGPEIFVEPNAMGRSVFAMTVAPVFEGDTEAPAGFVSETVRLEGPLAHAFSQEPQRQGDLFASPQFQLLCLAKNRGSTVAYLRPDETGRSLRLRIEPADPELVKRLRDGEGAESDRFRSFSYTVGGESRRVMMAYHRLTLGANLDDVKSKVYVLAYLPSTQAFSSIGRWTVKAIFAGFVFIAILCLMAYRNVHNNIIRNLALLNEGAQIIRQGDLDLKLVIHTGDEIEEVASSFNKMALALSRNINQLEASEENYRSLVTSMRDGIYRTDMAGTITFMNPAGVEVFGYARDEDALGQNLHDLFIEEIDMAQINSELDTKGFVERTRVWMKRVDGPTICVELSGNRLCDDEGHPTGIEGIFRDVTTSVRLEQEAHERSERIAAINQIANVINSSLEAGRLYESLAVELRRLVNFDFAAVALWNDGTQVFDAWQLWPEHETGPGHTYALDPRDSYAAWVAQNGKSIIIDNCAESEHSLVGQFREDTCSCLSVPLYAMGKVIGTLDLGSHEYGAFDRHDIEVLEQMAPHVAVAIGNAQLLADLHASLEEVTRAREKLYDANEELKTLDEMKTNLLSNVSHELRTPLVSVMGYTDMISNGKAGPVTETQAKYLSISLRNIEKLVTLIENLLDFSRLYRGTERLIFDTFDLVDCARTSMQIIQPVADGRNIALRLTTSHEPVLVEGDKGKLGQVFNNLLSNAVKFNSNGGTVIIAIRQSGSDVNVTVSDDGIGIPAAAQDKIFTRFYQYDSSSTRKYGGTGIGLAISQDIARLHGSMITVTSEEGKGSAFRFTLPCAEDRQDRSDGPSETGPPTSVQTHLLVELVTQDRALSSHVRELLASEGMDMIHAAALSYALVLARRHSPDIVLIDLDSGEMGEQGIKDLLADSSVASLPLVILTNDDDLYDRHRNEVAARVKRSFRKSTLLSTLNYALRREPDETVPLGAKILCVDDDSEILNFMRECLEAEGYEIALCDSGERAMELVMSHDFCLVLLDIAMPGVDGWETCELIKAQPTLRGISVCMVTAKPMGSNSLRLQDAGADGYLLKPFRPDELLELVDGFVSLPATPQGPHS